MFTNMSKVKISHLNEGSVLGKGHFSFILTLVYLLMINLKNQDYITFSDGRNLTLFKTDIYNFINVEYHYNL